MKELKCEVVKPLTVRIDNKSVICLGKNPTSHGRNKHIETRFHFIRDQMTNGMVELQYCPSLDANGFSKDLELDRFEFLKKKLGVFSIQQL